jgi:iron complex transport system substrate-binding protein
MIAIIIALTCVTVYMLYPNHGLIAPQEVTISITDDFGYMTNLTGIPEKIVSLAPSNTQILYEIGVGDRVVGVTNYADYPYNFSAWIEAGNMTSVGGYKSTNMEAIANLAPDLIFSTTINNDDVPYLRNLGYKVIVTNPNSIDDVYRNIEMIGKATGAQENAAALINKIQNQINTINEKIAHANIEEEPTVYYEIFYGSSGLRTAGSTSWINDVIAKAGGINIFNNVTQQYPNTSGEVIVNKNPDVILMPTDMGSFQASIENVKNRPGWHTIDAVKNDRIYIIDKTLFNQPGARVGEQVQAVAASLYPELFD